MAKEYFKSIFTGFLAGSIIAVIFNQWIFLEMRVNINSVIPLSILAGLAVCHFTRIKFKLLIIFILELIFGLLVFLLYNFSFESYCVIPASMFREGFHLSTFSLREVNLVIIAIFTLSNLVIFRELKMVNFNFIRQIDES
jgi:hypothetical protein